MEEEQRRYSTRSASNSMLVPYARRQLAVVPYTRLRIPRGWRVKEVIRGDGSRSDRYFYEPESGRKFRSMKEIDRYINGEPYPVKSITRSRRREASQPQRVNKINQSRKCCKMMVSSGKLLSVDDGTVVREAPSILPDGWIVEEVPRRRNLKFSDKYYYEPVSGQQFRSLAAVERYLEDLSYDAPLAKTLEEIMENRPLARAFKLDNYKSTAQRKQKISHEKSSFLGPPMKVTWVIASAQGDSWNPFIAEASVPDSVKQQWTDRFMLLMKDVTSNSHNSQE